MAKPKKAFHVSFTLYVEEYNNILSSLESNHEEDIQDLVTDLFYDVDDVTIKNVSAQER